MRITLFHTCTGEALQKHRYGLGHLGLAYIGACLLRDGHDVRVLDAKNEPLGDAEIRRHALEFQPNIFGATAMTHEIHAAADACGIAKGVNREILTVVGGPHSSALPERTLAEFPMIDVATVGEGENTMRELCEALAGETGPAGFEKIPGIAYRSGDLVRRTESRRWIENLDALPFPAWHLFPAHIDWPMFASRGCPFGCIFCQRVMGRRARLRTVDNVIAELDAREEELGQHSVWFQDETFGVNRRWLEEFLEKMKARNTGRKEPYTWGGNSRVNLADVSLYRKMREAGCTNLGFGVESGNDEILKRIHKGTTRDMAIRAIRAAREAGIVTGTFYIIGHPGETWRTALETASLAAKCGSDHIAVGVMVPYPGTEIWSMAKAGEYGYRLLSEDWRVYDKYFGNALAIRGLSHSRLEFLQGFTYFWFYVYNFRVKELARFVAKYRREAWFLLKRVLHLTPIQKQKLAGRD